MSQLQIGQQVKVLSTCKSEMAGKTGKLVGLEDGSLNIRIVLAHKSTQKPNVIAHVKFEDKEEWRAFDAKELEAA